MIYQQKADFDWWLPKFDRSDSSVSGTPFIKPNQYAYAGAVTIHPI